MKASELIKKIQALKSVFGKEKFEEYVSSLLLEIEGVEYQSLQELEELYALVGDKNPVGEDYKTFTRLREKPTDSFNSQKLRELLKEEIEADPISKLERQLNNLGSVMKEELLKLENELRKLLEQDQKLKSLEDSLDQKLKSLENNLEKSLDQKLQSLEDRLEQKIRDFVRDSIEALRRGFEEKLEQVIERLRACEERQMTMTKELEERVKESISATMLSEYGVPRDEEAVMKSLKEKDEEAVIKSLKETHITKDNTKEIRQGSPLPIATAMTLLNIAGLIARRVF